MECKGISYFTVQLIIGDWNISRMECKAVVGSVTIPSIAIGIYPEWNVKY